MFGSIADVYAEQGAVRTLRLGVEHTLLRSSLASPTTKSLYWAIAPAYYRYQYPTDFDSGPASPDPFKLEPVSPSRITRFTRRCYPPWWNRRQLFGSVKGGDWDKRPHEEAPTYGGPPEHLFHAESIDKSPLYQSLRAHFFEDCPWVETQFIQDIFTCLDDGIEFVWHDCRDRDDVLARCETLDELYRSMKREGCVSYRDRTVPHDRDGDFIDSLEREIIVDVARDGELLLVSGKHRFCIARLLELDTVPVAFLVRHTDWMRTRRAVADGRRRHDDHPDLRDVQTRLTDTASKPKSPV